MTRPRALMTLADVAWPTDAGKRLRAESMLRALSEHFDVDVVVLFADASSASSPLPPDISARWTLVEPHSIGKPRAALNMLRRAVPWQIATKDWTRARRAASRFGLEYDLVWFGALDHLVGLEGVVRARYSVVDCDDVETTKLQGFLRVSRGSVSMLLDGLQRRIELPMWARIQRHALRIADRVLVCSELDRVRLIEQAAKGDDQLAARVFAVPNTYPHPGPPVPRVSNGSHTVSMIANYGTDQNRDAATFAALQVLPELRGKVPDARLRLSGRRPDRIGHLRDVDGLDIVGPLDSVRSELTMARVVLVPMRFGGGTRLKILEAMAYGVPVVSTTVGAEGLAVQSGRELLIADSPAQIVDAVCEVLGRAELTERLSKAGRVCYEKHYQPAVTQDLIDELLDTLNTDADPCDRD